MATRKNLRHDDRTRQKIQTSQLVNRLTDHALGKVELSTSQVRSIEVLLRKTLPDLSAIHSTDGEEKSFEDWLNELPSKTGTA